jgi:hypothetical protein
VPEDLTPREKLMDTDGDGKVSREERRAFREGALETVAGMGGDKWALSYALVTQLGQSDDPDAQAMFRWLESKAQEYFRNPVGFSDAAYVREFNAQPWAQKYKSNAIRDMDFEAQFPDLYRESLEADIETLRDEAVQYGVDPAAQDLIDLAKQRRRFGLNAAQMRNAFANMATATTGDFRGAVGNTQTALRDWARRNGVALTDNIINNYVRRVTAGDMTEDDVFRELRRTYVAGAYPGWADRIEAGQDIYDISAPYRQAMANLLELPDDEIDFNDQLLKRGLQAIGDDGKPRTMPLYEFEQSVRKDPRWQQDE